MIKEACVQIDNLSDRDRRLRAMKYGRRNHMRYIDKLLNELEMLNLADQRKLPRAISVAVDKLIDETGAADAIAIEQRPVDSIPDAMDLLYEIQDSLMFNQIEDE